MGFGRFISLLCLVLLLAPGAYGEGQLLLIDRSGSMAKYYENGVVKTLSQRINDIFQTQPLAPSKIGAFNDHVEIVPSIDSIQVGGSTYLDAALDYALANHYSLVWMITDNVQHRAGEEEGKTRVFYDKLKEESIKRVVIFPIKQEPGTAGIIVYAMLLSDDADEIFKKETEEFGRTTSNTVLLPMKPLDRDTIETIFIENETTKRNRPIYAEGSTVQETMQIRFKSKFEHLRIVDADIVNPRVSPEFSRTSLLRFEKDEIRINPTKVTELNPKGETVQLYTVTVDLGRIRLKRDPVSLWKAALSKPIEDIALELSFSIKVPKEKFQFTDSFLEEYGAPTTELAKTQGKIYDLHELPLLVAENRTSIDVPHKPKIRVQYPGWLALIFPGAPLALLALLGAGGLFIWRRAAQLGKGRTRWKVDVVSPPEGRGQIQGGLVTVTVNSKVNRLGRVKGESFIPATGVTPANAQTIKEGLPMSLTFRKNDFSLIFRKSSGEPIARENKKDGKTSEVKI